jgi:hypothetical protein
MRGRREMRAVCAGSACREGSGRGELAPRQSAPSAPSRWPARPDSYPPVLHGTHSPEREKQGAAVGKAWRSRIQHKRDNAGLGCSPSSPNGETARPLHHRIDTASPLLFGRAGWSPPPLLLRRVEPHPLRLGLVLAMLLPPLVRRPQHPLLLLDQAAFLWADLLWAALCQPESLRSERAF